MPLLTGECSTSHCDEREHTMIGGRVRSVAHTTTDADERARKVAPSEPTRPKTHT